MSRRLRSGRLRSTILAAAAAFLSGTAATGAESNDTAAATAATASGVRAPALTGSIALATHYVSRGLDISDGPPVPQAGFEYAGVRGFYADGYAAKIRYFRMDAEVDAAVGYRNETGRVKYDLGIYYYYYPGADPALHANFAELGTKLMRPSGPWTPVVEMYISNNYFFGAGTSLFFWTGTDLALPWQATASARVGYVTVADNRAFSYPDYSTWLLSAAKQVAGLSVSLQVTDTSLRRPRCIGESRCAVKVTLKVAKEF